MGFIVFVICSPILIPLLIILFVLGLKGDEWFNHQKPHQKRYYYDEYDDDFDDYYRTSSIQGTKHYESDSSNPELYGGLPYNDGEIFIADNEDMIDQMDF